MREIKKHLGLLSLFLLSSTIKSPKYLKLLDLLNIVHVNGGWVLATVETPFFSAE